MERIKKQNGRGRENITWEGEKDSGDSRRN